MKRTTRTRKKGVKNARINSKKEEQRSIRETVIRWCGTGITTMGAGNSQVYDLTTDFCQDVNTFTEPSRLIPTQSVMDNPVKTSQTDGQKPDPTNRCPVCSSTLKPVFIIGQSNNEMLRCPRCPIPQLLCGSCLYPCNTAGCNNKLCALVSTLLTCELVNDPKSMVSGCPMFRACPKCYNLIMHETGCKHVRCKCQYKFCFICLQSDCNKDSAQYWKLTCAKQRAERQRFIHTDP